MRKRLKIVPHDVSGLCLNIRRQLSNKSRRKELKKKKENSSFSLNLNYRRSGTLDGIHAESSFRPWPSSGDEIGKGGGP